MTDSTGSAASPSAATPTAIPAYVERISVRNFRGITECEVELESTLTILAGRNNSGKSRVLSALLLALGGRPADIDDFTVGRETEPEIDIVIAPSPPSSSGGDEVFGAAIARQFPNAVQSLSELPLRERIAWRTTVMKSAEGMGARSESCLLVFDENAGVWAKPSDASHLTRAMRAPIAVDLINTGRDLMEELGRRGSSIRKVLSDLEVPDAKRAVLEGELGGLSQKILDESQTLQSVSRALQDLHDQIGTMGAPALNPLPGKLEELARLISIDLDTGSGGLPLRFHGSGTRSLASLQVQSVLYDRRLGRDGTSVIPMPVTLVEEPEAHLHPQAVMELGPLLHLLQGQKVVTTHSPQLVSHVDPRAIRLLRPRSHGLNVVDLGPASSDAAAPHRAFRPALHLVEMEKMKRLVERPFGELLFADAIVVGDGATERAFLPIIIKCAFGDKSHGVCVVDPGSLGSEHGRAIVKFAQMTGTPWIALADGDKAGQDAVALLLPVGGGDGSRIVWVNGTDANGQPNSGAFEDMIHSFDASLCRQACDAVRPDLSSEHELTVMKKSKGAIGATLADLVVAKYPSTSQWPQSLQELTSRLGLELL